MTNLAKENQNQKRGIEVIKTGDVTGEYIWNKAIKQKLSLWG